MKRPLLTLRNFFPLWILLLVGGIVAGLVAAAIVLTRGLVVTNLTDFVPWGLWIGIDLSSIALSAGAFLLSAAVYLLHLDDLKPVARTAVFIGFLGYSMAMMTLLMDIGRPDRFWHAFAFWNIHSPLWEVTMCVGVYFTVLTLEVLPIVAGMDWLHRRWPTLSTRVASIHRLAPALAVAGLCLSLLHQSSLGATYGVLKSRPFWYKPSLAVLFLVSDAAAGPALTVFASRVAAALTDRARIDEERLNKVAYFVGWVLLGLIYLRFWDTMGMEYTYQPARTEALEMLTRGPLAFNFWVGELLLGLIVPAVILLKRRWREQPRLQMLALLLVVAGLVAYRWDTNIVGQLVVFSYYPEQSVPLFTAYTPSLIEWLVGLGVVSIGLLGFTIGVRTMYVVDHTYGHEDEHEPQSILAAAD